MNRTTTIAMGSVLALAALAFSANSGFAQVIGNGNGNAGLNAQSQAGIGNGAGNTNNVQQSNNNLSSAQRTNVSHNLNGNLNGNQNGNGSGNMITENNPQPVPNVFAPGLAAAGSEVCLGSVSGGGSGSGFGVTIGGTFVDRECQLRLNARTLATLGYPVAARETMCLDEDVRRAMYAAGTPCSYDRNGWAQSGGWYSQAQQQTYAQAQQQTQVAAAPTSQAAAALQPPTASAPVASSQPDSASGSNCNGVFGTWFNRCGSQKVSEASTAAKKQIARAKPATQSKEANAKRPAHEAAATPETASTQVAAESAVH